MDETTTIENVMKEIRRKALFEATQRLALNVQEFSERFEEITFSVWSNATLELISSFCDPTLWITYSDQEKKDFFKDTYFCYEYFCLPIKEAFKKYRREKRQE